MEIDPRRLIVLRAVERHGGVVAAAAALHISPSAVSQQLVLLERETGFALIDRSRRGGHRSIQFTTAGRRRRSPNNSASCRASRTGQS